MDNSWLEGVELLIKSGTDVNKKDTLGHTALMIAVENSWLEGVELLIGSGTNVDEKDASFRTALTRAAEKGNDELVELFIEAGADVTRRPPYFQWSYSSNVCSRKWEYSLCRIFAQIFRRMGGFHKCLSVHMDERREGRQWRI